MGHLKIVCLGAGSRYFQTVIAECAVTAELAGAEFMLYDIDKKRMNRIWKVAQRINDMTAAGFTIGQTTDLAKALDGADFAVSSIGVHGAGYQVHKADQDAVLKFGIVQTTGDTVGPAGLSQGLRIIPIYVDIARKMEKYCPNVILLNHSNPMNPICRAITKYTKIRVVGYCHNVGNDVRYFGELLGIPWRQLQTRIAGCNHCNWMLGLRHEGRNLMPRLLRKLRARRQPEKHIFALEVYDTLGVYPIAGDRHLLEFFPHARRATTKWNLEYGQTSRSEWLAKDKSVPKKERDTDLRAAGKLDPWIPTAESMSPEAMGNQLRAMSCGPEIVHYVNTVNNGAVTNLPDWAFIELEASVGTYGARAIHFGDLPPAAARFALAQVYAHELLVEAAVEGSRAKAVAALACDPMIRDFREPEAILDALVEAQGARLKCFKRRGPARKCPKVNYRVPVD